MPNPVKRCNKCFRRLALSSFAVDRSKKDGRTHSCKACKRKYALKQYRKTSHEERLLWRSRTRAKTKNVPHSITIKDIKISPVCPVLKIRIRKGFSGGVTSNSPSLDRIVPKLGYVPGNVAVISQRANTLKNNLTVDQAKNLLEYMEGVCPVR